MSQVWKYIRARELKRGMITAGERVALEIGKVEPAKKGYIRVVTFVTDRKEQHEITHPEEWTEYHPTSPVLVAVSGVEHVDLLDFEAVKKAIKVYKN